MKTKGILFTILALVTIFGVTIAQAEVLPPGGGSGAIFTTTPDGSIVNENVHYAGRQYVYLDGGPKQNAPAHAAGLDEGFYVFQITDPPGKLLLSRDPARCRIVHVNQFGVIDQLMAPTDASETDPDGNTVLFYTGAASSNWQDPGNGSKPYASQPCHVQEGPDGAPGTYAPTPDITGVGRHDTNTDVDHGLDLDAIVVQMMPYGLTPNPGGVYKAWLTPIQAYVNVKGADLNKVPVKLNGQQKPHPCYDFCASADPGFVPSHRYTKTDNFKVTEKFPAEIKVRKFEDLNGNGLWDDGEPEIGVDKCVDDGGNFVACPGGWPYDFTEPLNGGTKTDTFYTPGIHVAAIPGVYSAEEFYLDGWVQTASWLDGAYQSPFQKLVSVLVAASAPGETHEIRFGNFKLVDVTACKVEDADGNKDTTDDQTPVPGWTVYLSIDGFRQSPGMPTGEDGCYTWTGLGPGHSYDVEEDDPAPEWTALTALTHNFGPATSGASYSFTFANFKNVDVTACKYEDYDGDGGQDEPIPGWPVYLTVDGGRVDAQQTGGDGCYTWTNLGPLPANSYYDVEEDDPAPEWTATSPLSYDFESPPQSGASYRGSFTNFRNVDVTACKVKDTDGNLATTGDQTPKPGWPVYLTITGVRQAPTQSTGVDGCYTWTNLGPLPAGGYYDVGEDPQPGWIALTPTYWAFESPPQSGASYSFAFINTPVQGCTPGFWQGGPGGPDPQSGGARLWDGDPIEPAYPIYPDPDWVASGGMGSNPYIHVTDFHTFFGGYNPGAYTMFELVDTGGGEEPWRKLARDLVAAYLNASWGMAYAYTPTELQNIWAEASSGGTFLYWHTRIDAANNGPGGCPVSAGGY